MTVLIRQVSLFAIIPEKTNNRYSVTCPRYSMERIQAPPPMLVNNLGRGVGGDSVLSGQFNTLKRLSQVLTKLLVIHSVAEDEGDSFRRRRSSRVRS